MAKAAPSRIAKKLAKNLRDFGDLGDGNLHYNMQAPETTREILSEKQRENVTINIV